MWIRPAKPENWSLLLSLSPALLPVLEWVWLSWSPLGASGEKAKHKTTQLFHAKAGSKNLSRLLVV
jgi:hypothetical protein